MILTFINTRAVIQAERELKTKQLFYQVIPTPRHISSECGMCLKINKNESQIILDLLQTQNIVVVRQIENEYES